MKMEGEVENILEKLEGGRGGKDMHESRNNNSTHLRNHASCVSEQVFGGRVCEDLVGKPCLQKPFMNWN